MSKAPYVAGAALLALAVGFALAFKASLALPTEVAPIAWDKEPCAHCKMHVGDPGFATQVQLKDGAIHSFDDPGCMLSWLGDDHGPIHAIYLHHSKEDRWLRPLEVGFVKVETSPMGFGLAVVDRGAEGSIDFEAAKRAIAERSKR